MTRFDLQERFDITTEKGLLSYHAWCLAFGISDYKWIATEVQSKFVAYLTEPAPNVKQDVALPVSRALYAVWVARSDLQTRFDLETYKGRAGLIGWWLAIGCVEHKILELNESWTQALLEPAPNVKQDAALPVSRALYAVWVARSDLQTRFDLETYKGRAGLIGWWLAIGCVEHKILELNESWTQALLEPASNVKQDMVLPVSRALYAVWSARPDLQACFDLQTDKGGTEFTRWWLSHGRAEYDALSKALQKSENGCAVRASSQERPGRRKGDPLDSHLNDTCLDNGINIVGFARGELGIGEDVRMATAALTACQAPFVVYDLPIGIASANRR